MQAPYLRAGDKIGLVAPARKITSLELAPALERFRSWGLEPITSKNLFGSSNQFSGTDEERAADMQEMLDDPTIRAVICARGGYGTLRIINRIDFTAFHKSPKWVLGFSDVTVLHSYIHAMGIETLHSPMPLTFAKNEESVESMRKILFGEKPDYHWKAHPLNRAGEVEAPLVGGNLSLLYALSGTPGDLDTRNKILFLEDLDEYLYHIDRMMLNLKLSGKLENLAGLLVGGMSEMKDNPIPFGKNAEEIILDAVKDYSFPVSFGFPAGHGEHNLALPLGKVLRLKAGEFNSLRC